VVFLTIQVSCRKPLKNFGVCGKDGPTSAVVKQLPTPVFIGVRVFHKTPENFPCTITKYAITWLPTSSWIKSQPGVWVTPFLFYTDWCSNFCFTCTVNSNIFKIFATLHDVTYRFVLSTLLYCLDLSLPLNSVHNPVTTVHRRTRFIFYASLDISRTFHVTYFLVALR
jgi:hypothetical protein